MLDKRAILIVIVLVLISIYLTVYTLKAHTVAAQHICEEEGKIWWTSGPCGSLFPWPKEPGMLEVLSAVNEVDQFIYRYLIKTWVLVGLTFLLWISSALFIFKVFKASST